MEVLISVAILVILTTVILVRYQDFDSTVLLNSLAYDVALSLREAQVLGVSVRSDSGSFDVAYGMHFTTDTPTTYLLFSDQNENGRYTAGEEVSTYTIGQDNAIVSLCADGDCTLTTLDVMFLRPEPDAIIYTEPDAGGVGSVEVVVGAASGETRTVTTWTTGQISVE